MIDRRRRDVVGGHLLGSAAQKLRPRASQRSLSRGRGSSDRPASKRRQRPRRPRTTAGALARRSSTAPSECRQIGSRRFALGDDFVRVDVQRARIATHPAHRRPGRLRNSPARSGCPAWRARSWARRRRNLAARSTLAVRRPNADLSESPPAASVNGDHHRVSASGGGRVGRVDVEQLGLAVHRRKRHILILGPCRGRWSKNRLYSCRSATALMRSGARRRTKVKFVARGKATVAAGSRDRAVVSSPATKIVNARESVPALLMWNDMVVVARTAGGSPFRLGCRSRRCHEQADSHVYDDDWSEVCQVVPRN